MKVYRYLSEDELNKIKEGDVLSIGGYYYKNPTNSHRYDENERYLHFFANKKNYLYVRDLHYFNNKKCQFYLCEFNIPLRVLIRYAGVGYYVDMPDSGYDVSHVSKLEFAVPTSKFDGHWLVDYKKVEPFVEEEFC